MRLKIPEGAKVLHVFDGGWTLYKLKPKETDSFLWQKFRIMLDPHTPAKRGQHRAYPLSWSPLEQRFARDSYLAELAKEWPELHAWVELYMGLNYGPDWLTDEFGAYKFQDEIDAEVKRLKVLRNKRKADKAAARVMATPLSEFE